MNIFINIIIKAVTFTVAVLGSIMAPEAILPEDTEEAMNSNATQVEVEQEQEQELKQEQEAHTPKTPSSDTTKPSSNKPVSSAQTAQPSKPATTPPVATQKPKIETMAQYEKTILGLCPSERPASRWEIGSRLPALGITAETYTKISTDPDGTVNLAISAESYMLNAWDSYDRGQLGSSWSIPLYYVGYPQNDPYYRTKFIIDLTTLTVRAEGLKANDQDVLNHANRLTELVRTTSARYKAKCPNN